MNGICKIRIMLILTSCFVFTLMVHAQVKIKNIEDVELDKKAYYLVTLKNESTILCRFQERNGAQFIFQVDAYSKLSAYIEDIKHIRKIRENQIVKGSYRRDNIFHNRYFFTQSAFNIRRSEISISNHLAVQTTLEYGLTNHLSVYGGFNILNILDPNEFDNLNVFSAKLAGFKLDKNLTVGGSVMYANYFDKYVICSGLITLGNSNNNLTVGLGPQFSFDTYFAPPFYDEEMLDVSLSSLVTISGMVRVSPNVYLMSENWLAGSSDYQDIYSFGGRYAGRAFSFDLAVAYMTMYDDIVPYAGFSFRF